MSVRFWRSAGHFAASYKALFMHLTTVPSLYRPSTDGASPDAVANGERAAAHTRGQRQLSRDKTSHALVCRVRLTNGYTHKTSLVSEKKP